MSEQDDLFWKEAWKGMPEFIQEDKMPIFSLKVNFSCQDDIDRFSELVNQKITNKTKSIWFPKQENIKPSDYIYISKK